MSSTVLVSIVTYNSKPFIVPSLRSVLRQSLPPARIIATDNASDDETASLIDSEFGSSVDLICNSVNLGFARAHNEAIRSCQCRYVLTLNPDAVLATDFIETLVEFMEAHPYLGSASGKLLRMEVGMNPIRRHGRVLFDSTGIQCLPNQRHRDRGAGTEDYNQYNRPELVFGTTAAAGFYRKEMLRDVALDGQFFDEKFFIYREDVDLAWRAQLYGWSCGYQPHALGYHVRQGIPERRSSLSAAINYHSVKNRLLLRIKNMPLRMYARHFPAISSRDVLVVGYMLLREWHSLRAVSFWIRHWRLYLRYRNEIERRRRVPHAEIEKWIGWKPRSFPLPEPAPQSPVLWARAKRT